MVKSAGSLSPYPGSSSGPQRWDSASKPALLSHQYDRGGQVDGPARVQSPPTGSLCHYWQCEGTLRPAQGMYMQNTAPISCMAVRSKYIHCIHSNFQGMQFLRIDNF